MLELTIYFTPCPICGATSLQEDFYPDSDHPTKLIYRCPQHGFFDVPLEQEDALQFPVEGF